MNPPTNVEAKDIKADSITLIWKNPSGQQHSPIHIQYKTKQATEWISDPVQKTKETATLSGLKPDTEYEIRVTAVGQQGFSVSSDPGTVTVKTTRIPPNQLLVEEVKAHSITLIRRNPSDQQCRYLLIEYRMKQETEWTRDPLKKNQETITLSGLRPDTEYEIRVTAVYDGCYDSSDVVTAMTAKMTMNAPSAKATMNPPTNVEIREVQTQSITLTWRNPFVQYYKCIIIEYKNTHDTEWIVDPVQKNQETQTISGLRPDTEYKIRVTAVDKQNTFLSSDVVTAVTNISPPTNVHVNEVKANSMTLTWRNSSAQKCKFQYIEYKTKQATEWISESVKENQEAVTLSGLKPGTEYEIRVTAVGKQGCSVSSDVVIAMTQIAINPPTNLEVKEVKADSINVSWINPFDQGCQLLFLIIECRKTQQTEWIPHTVRKNQDTWTLSGLKPQTEYEIRVIAVGKQGCSVHSNAVTAVTDKTAMNPPTNVEVNDIKADSINVLWRNPFDQQCQFLNIEYRMTHDAEWVSHPVQKSQETATLTGLKPDTEYEIRVTVEAKGCSVSSDPVTAVTAKTTMDPPTNVIVKEVKADSITLAWTNPSDKQYQYLLIEYRMKGENGWRIHPMQKNLQTATLSKLEQNIEYEIRVTAAGGTRDCTISSDTITAVTKAPSSPTAEIKEMTGDSEFTSHSMQNNMKTVMRSGLKADSECGIGATTVGKESCFGSSDAIPNTSGKLNIITPSSMSKAGEEIKTQEVQRSLDPRRFIHHSPGNPAVYLLRLKPDTGSDFKKMIFGGPARCLSNKTIMLVGATGSGKTTLINGMINYILGVDWKDNWRFKLIDEEANKSQAHSQTSEVTAYQIHHTDEFKVPFSLTIIDTPGFGDTRGIKQDKEITEVIRQFFTNKNGIATIDAVCFVVQGALARLTHTQKYIFESILSVFGKDIASNIITLVTFADGKSPPALEAIKEANIPCATQDDGSPVHFKFNNSVLFVNNTLHCSDEESFDYLFWKMGKGNMKKFFSHLDTMKTQSLILTKKVLEERKQLEANVQGVQPLIRKGLSTMEEIRTTQAILDKHRSDIEKNKNFEYFVEVEKAEKINISQTSTTNCHTCKYTCHYPCQIYKDKKNCASMKSGFCTVCPLKCAVHFHSHMNYKWETKRVRVKKTYHGLKEKYEKAVGAKMNTEQIVAKLEMEYRQVQGKVLEMTQTLSKCLKRLNEIALRPDPLSTPNYIDLLIQSEEEEASPGYKQRIRELQEVREGAVLLQNVAQSIPLSREENWKLQMIMSKSTATCNDFLDSFGK